MLKLAPHFLSLLLLASSALAGSLPYPEFVKGFRALEAKAEKSPIIVTYVTPNEVNPELAIPILRTAPTGAYITVGTERAFMSAAMDDHATYLFTVDRDPNVTLYNRINTMLLKASYDPALSMTERREKYLELRMKSQETEWVKASGPDHSKEVIREYFSAWKKFVRETKSPAFRAFHLPPFDQEGAAFRSANYLFNDVLFEKIQMMAVQDRIQSIVMDLGAPDVFEKFSKLLARSEIKVSVFDMSNAWYEQYLGPKRTSHLFQTLEKDGNFTDETILLLTDHHDRVKSYAKGIPAKRPMFSTISSLQEVGFHEEYDWSYHGYRRVYLKSQSKTGLLEIGGRSKLKESSLDDVATAPKLPNDEMTWCYRLVRFFGIPVTREH